MNRIYFLERFSKNRKRIKRESCFTKYDLKNNHTTIIISKNTRQKLNEIRKRSESYDVFLQTLLEHIDTCDRFWEDRF